MSRDVRVREIATPFRVSFRHAAADRSAAQSVWVEFSDGDCTGMGEGCPREYVTGESTVSAIRFLERVKNETSGIGNLDQLRHWVSGNRERIDAAPAAWCAIELAMLDCFARRESISVEALLGLPSLAATFHYTAVLGDSGEAVFAAQLKQYRSLGFRDFKLKISGDADRDRARIQAICTQPTPTLRLDANNLWPDVHALNQWRAIVQAEVLAVEEPLETRNLDELRVASDNLEVPVILDENFLRLEQLAHVVPDPERWILNVRVSKMGGLLRSLEIANAAREAGLRMIVGAQVGETSVLTRAALPVAQAAADLLVGQEGAFGEHLLERDLVEPVLQFGYAGRLESKAVAGEPGWGLRSRSE